jgi:putative transposase
VEQTEGAKFWLKVFNDLKTRGCQDILIAVTDGHKGMSDALEAAYPATTLQTCLVHLIRNSLDLTTWKERKPLAAALRAIYTAPTADAAAAALDAFAAGPWGQRFPTIVKQWRTAWARVTPFFAFPPDVRRVIYTTNALSACTPASARSSRPAAIFRPTRPRPSSSGWRSATSPPTGRSRPTTGKRP